MVPNGLSPAKPRAHSPAKLGALSPAKPRALSPAKLGAHSPANLPAHSPAKPPAPARARTGAPARAKPGAPTPTKAGATTATKPGATTATRAGAPARASASDPTPARIAALAISIAPRPSPREKAALFTSGSLEEAVAAFRRRFGAPSRALLEAARGWADSAERSGSRILLLGEPDYPPRLAEIATPPIALEAAGAPDPSAPGIAVVGSRRATRYGLEVAARFAGGLAAAGLTVVSGLARGVDAAAHRAALRAGGRTVAVLGSALDRLYPPEHRQLARECAAAGAVLTEFPPGAPPLPRHFPRRNRIIAGLTLGTLVVEAAERSGSLSTARHAADSGREVFAVPGPIGSPTSAGCHAIIRLGATLVTSVEEILEELGPLADAERAARE